MLSTDLGACEWFVWDLRRSNLIDRGQLDQVIGEFLSSHPGVEPPALAEYLVSKGILTPFQAERLLQGKTQGFVLGPYTLMDALGTGSMGTVYKARSKNDNRWYAVKVLPRRSMWNVRIARRKVRAFEQVQHPAVVPFVDVGTAGGMHYLVWPMVEGETLEVLVKREGKLDPGLAAQFALQTAEGLDVCHQQGLFHGQLKPSNLMVGPDGQVRILDFGIGCLLAETEGESLVDTMSTANSVASGLDCASPESIMDPTQLNAIGDQYSLGCVLYFCLTGRYPFPEGTAVEKMMAHQTKQPPAIKEFNPDVPDALVAVVNRLMQKQPAERYPSTAAVIEALRPLAKGRPAAPAAAPRPAARPAPAREVRPERSLSPEPSSGADMPRPAARPVPPPAPRVAANGAGLPPRPSLQPAIPAAPVAAAPAAADPVRPAARAPVVETDENQPARSWDERLGPVGIIILTVLACVVAYFLTRGLF
ncbi:MAG TPA: serine/threonine-protein kinase [Gemmataceae bacterium]|nr:serine/threonine-protein kinase [Gemmataceae bacterium]